MDSSQVEDKRNTQKVRDIKPDDLLVSKADLQGNIIYCNSEFMIYSGYYLEELIGEKHTITAHSDMPKSVFQYMWKELESFNEVCSVVKNQSKEGAYFWTFMNVTPTFGVDNEPVGYFFVQRSLLTENITYFDSLYKKMSLIEQDSNFSEEGLEASFKIMEDAAAKQGGHNEFVYSYYA